MTELQRRMIEDMQLAGLSQGTQEAYVRVVRQLAGHFSRAICQDIWDCSARGLAIISEPGPVFSCLFQGLTTPALSCRCRAISMADA